jgi:hypothetical protein
MPHRLELRDVGLTAVGDLLQDRNHLGIVRHRNDSADLPDALFHVG